MTLPQPTALQSFSPSPRPARRGFAQRCGAEEPFAMSPKPLPQHTRDALIAAARDVAAKRGSNRLSLPAFCKATGINPARIYARFDDWPTLCADAGLRPGEKPPEISSDRLLADLHAAIVDSGGNGASRAAASPRRKPPPARPGAAPGRGCRARRSPFAAWRRRRSTRWGWCWSSA